ncbi:acyltransferase [Pseudoalteromonas tunicata]|uniref:acyltransferase family protein n=1 Tax=Pseudoalteromonas tunicata TaxID=314281 RepID=UPI00273FD948|nr:acyltransferase [Pseudoalteromonas tunicata]MDP5211852.1 acyltransferase [Pseudoalteromonas tunicata]
MSQRFYALDAFRGMCALCVVLFHMNVVGTITEVNFFRGSSIFVEFFFVLSGFVLTHSYANKANLDFKGFIQTRFYRLYPLHLFVFFLFLLIEFAKLAAFKFAGFTFNYEPFTHFFAPKEIIPNLLLLQAWTPFTEPLSFNSPSWSISVEFYLYILFYVTLVLVKQYKVLLWLSLVLFAFYLKINESDLIVSWVQVGVLCFFGGSLTYLVYQKTAHFRPSIWLGTGLELAALISVLVLVQSQGTYRFLIGSMLFFATVLIFAFEAGLLSRFLKFQFFQFFAKLSYSIYMIHAVVLFCITAVLIILQKVSGIELAPLIDGSRYFSFGNDVVNNLMVLVLLAVVVGLSYFSYQFIELKGIAFGKLRKENKSINGSKLLAVK